MSSTYTSLNYHIIFSTKERRPFITPEWQFRLYDYIGGIVRNEKGLLRCIGGVADHMHLLVTLPPTRAISDWMRVIKCNSSGWIHDTFADQRLFAWQDGYGAFSVSKSAMPEVERYIANQEEHHRRVTFKDEFVEFLRRNEIEYDDRYLWD